MIKKFIKIAGVGKFLNYTHSSVPGPHRTSEFKKANLVYGENGSGKTTLALILKSLKGNNPLLAKKQSFDRSVTQTVEVLTDATPTPTFKYVSLNWDNHYANIEIFDVHFVNENIYTGLEIQNSHKRNLFEIIFGQQGIQLKTAIETIKAQIQTAQGQIRETTQNIEIGIGRVFNATEFSEMAVDPAIDQKIEAKRLEISTAQSFSEIQSKTPLVDIPLIVLPYVKADLVGCLTKSIESISSDYLEKVRNHKNHLSMGGESERWIKQGFESIKDNSCPFCLRPFDPVPEIVAAYNQYFNQEYNDLLRSLSQLSSTVIGFNLEARILQAESRITSNLALIGFWERHIPTPPTLNSLTEEIGNLNTAYEAVKLAVRNKASNPIQSIDGAVVEVFQTLIENLNHRLTSYNSEIRNYNNRISELKSSTRQNIPQLESELKKLNAIKLRADGTIASLCTTLSGQVQSLSTLNTQKTTKQAELDSYSVTVFQGYSLRINQYLQIFAPYLEIRDLSSGYVGQSTSPSVNYALHVHGTEVKQDDSTYPSFKYTLSEGDKNALALSFFLAKLESDGNIQNKIVVFDDPVSSFDLNRKASTISKLVSIGSQAKQLFVLTHNIVFAGEFWKNVQQISVPSQCSKVEFINNTSCIVEYNIDTETLFSVLKDSLLIKNYLTNGCLSDQDRRAIARALRPALESYFHLKFFDLVSNDDWLGDFISKVRNATSTDPFFRLQSSLTELTDINDYSKSYHHRFNTACDNQPVNDAELRTYCQRTLNLIQVI